MIHNIYKFGILVLLFPGMLFAQNVKKLSLQEAIQLGVDNSKNLKLSQNRIEESIARLSVVKNNALPTANASFLYNHAEIPSNSLVIGGADPVQLPKRANAYVGTAAVEQLVYGGGKLKYAEQSTRLLTEVSQLDAEKDKDDISYAVIDTYYNLYKITKSKKIVAQNLESIAAQLKQSQRFFDQGIVTKNDVLRFKLQQANISLTQMEIESNRKIVNYNLNILLGLADDTEVEVIDPAINDKPIDPLNNYIDFALSNRQEIKQLDLRNQVADLNIKSIKANTLPTVGVGANLYYINPSGSFVPPSNQYLMPMTIGANIAWNIGNLWTNKNKVSEAKFQQKDVEIQKDIFSDNIKKEINRNYQSYHLALNKIQVLETSITQATENDKLLASKYQNNVASAIDRIDAETLLYQAKINLEIAKADAGLAYYTLLKSTGKITQ